MMGPWTGLRLTARLLTPAMALAARAVPLPRLLPLLAGRGVGPGLSAAAVEAVLATTARGTCLTRALVRFTLLRRAGVPARLVVGVSRPAGGFAAHAWIELDGAPLGENPLAPPLRPIYSYPEA